MTYRNLYKSFGLLYGQSFPQNISLFLNLIVLSDYLLKSTVLELSILFPPNE